MNNGWVNSNQPIVTQQLHNQLIANMVASLNNGLDNNNQQIVTQQLHNQSIADLVASLTFSMVTHSSFDWRSEASSLDWSLDSSRYIEQDSQQQYTSNWKHRAVTNIVVSRSLNSSRYLSKALQNVKSELVCLFPYTSWSTFAYYLPPIFADNSGC